MNKPRAAGLIFATAVVGLVAACGDGPTETDLADPAPSSSAVSSTSEPRVVDADLADYANGRYCHRFALDGFPLRECAPLTPPTGRTPRTTALRTPRGAGDTSSPRRQTVHRGHGRSR